MQINLLRSILEVDSKALGVMLVNDDQMARTSKSFRGKYESTDVLSFPSRDFEVQ